MSDNIKWDVAKTALTAAIRACSSVHGKTAKRTLELITECTRTFKEILPDRPQMIGEVLGEYLAEAANLERPDAIIHLAQMGANIEWRDTSGMTPLHVAAEHGRHEVIEILAAIGADIEAVHATKFHHYTALHIAVEAAKPDAVSVLLNLGANAAAEDDLTQYKTPFQLAASRPAANMSGAFTPSEDDRHANELTTVALVNLFISAGADPQVGSPKGGFPLHFAIAHTNSSKVVLALLEAATYDQPPLDYALWLAVAHDQRDVIEPLLKAGANLFSNHDGETLQEYAEKRNGSHAKKTAQLINALTTEASVEKAMPSRDDESAVTAVRSRSTPSL